METKTLRLKQIGGMILLKERQQGAFHYSQIDAFNLLSLALVGNAANCSLNCFLISEVIMLHRSQILVQFIDQWNTYK